MTVQEQKIQVTTKDNRVLSALLIEPESPSLAVLMSPGVAIPKERYLNFAKAGAARGAAVLIYDYRGQAASVQGDIRTDRTGFSEWGRFDMTAAIAELDRRFPQLKMVAMGHSAGGWIVGLAENYDRIAKHIFLCVGWAYHKLKPLPFRWIESFFWHVYGPACLGVYGHIPKGGLWRGEAINPQLFAEWKAWCHVPQCTFELLAGGADKSHGYDRISAPIDSFAYRDDPIANERTVPIFLNMFPRSNHNTIWASPADFGLDRLGHDGVFSRKAAEAWKPVWDSAFS